MARKSTVAGATGTRESSSVSPVPCPEVSAGLPHSPRRRSAGRYTAIRPVNAEETVTGLFVYLLLRLKRPGLTGWAQHIDVNAKCHTSERRTCVTPGIYNNPEAADSSTRTCSPSGGAKRPLRRSPWNFFIPSPDALIFSPPRAPTEARVNEDNCAAVKSWVLRADTGHVRRVWSRAGMEGRWEREIPEKTHRPAASSGTILTCENPGVTRPGIEPGSPWWDGKVLGGARTEYLTPRDHRTYWGVHMKSNARLHQHLPRAEIE
ncbi:hypothetical protein PR048_032674 [Dryococelus australis]|uniref:Uncharacterized protein n=1 Tax=Dryococelus australis TaxID=614101 RepID=A0ABQ9G2V9_9NEOP|nr:hypothetical protein PR048_032674 [Dryococelus australis]